MTRLTIRFSRLWPCLPFQRVSLPGDQIFELSISPPNADKIPSKADLLGVTIMMITALYRRQEFFRCSYFVYNNYPDSFIVPDKREVYIEKIMRNILTDKPRIRVNEIFWDTSMVNITAENISQFIRDFKTVQNNKRTKKKRGSKSKNQKSIKN